jgi:hypothetical protein
MKFPVNSLLAGNLAFSETSSQLTPPSSGESANPRSPLGSGAKPEMPSPPIARTADRRRFDTHGTSLGSQCESPWALWGPIMNGRLLARVPDRRNTDVPHALATLNRRKPKGSHETRRWREKDSNPWSPLGSAQLSRHARGGPLPSADSLRIQPSSSIRSAAMKASGWSSMTWCLASGTSTTGARGPIRDDM